jgi:hypothetical protein
VNGFRHIIDTDGLKNKQMAIAGVGNEGKYKFKDTL